MTTITSIFLAFCFAIPSIGTESPLKECNGTLAQRQAIVDTEDLALYLPLHIRPQITNQSK